MRYFESLIPQITQGDSVFFDMFQNFDIVGEIDQEYLFTYQMKDGETLQDVALTFYDDPQLWWLICLINDIKDPFFDVVMSDEYIQQVAVVNASNNPTFWGADGDLFWEFDEDLFWFDQTDYIAEYEIVNDSNELKRQINIINPKFLPDIITQILDLAASV